MKWIAERKDAPEKLRQTLELLACELVNAPLSNINIHTKVESLIKDEPIMNW